MTPDIFVSVMSDMIIFMQKCRTIAVIVLWIMQYCFFTFLLLIFFQENKKSLVFWFFKKTLIHEKL